MCLMHDPMCLFRFEEHDIFLPMIVLEELDSHKKGMTEVARNARQTSRSLDALAAATGADIKPGSCAGQHRTHRRRWQVVLPDPTLMDVSLPISLPQGKAGQPDPGRGPGPCGSICAPREVVLVSKDINMRVKARALGLAAEDYQNDKTLEDGDLLYSGAMALPTDFWIQPWQSRGKLAAGQPHFLPHQRARWCPA
jgi:PhoH-like ATPase